MYYPCSENKGADQLRGYREADLRLCFRICKKPVFSMRGSFDNDYNLNLLSSSDTVLCLSFQHCPRDISNFNEWKIMFDPSVDALVIKESISVSWKTYLT